MGDRDSSDPSTPKTNSEDGRHPERNDASDRPTLPPRLERIQTRAYELYEARGGERGVAMDDWLQAEREIDGE